MEVNKKVWLDCDPGIDDMLAIILACLSPQLQVLGISTSSGNSTLENTTQNTLNIL
jgi:purine nucleosidase